MHSNYFLSIFPQLFTSLGKDITAETLPYYSKIFSKKWDINSAQKISNKRLSNTTEVAFVCDYVLDQNAIDSLKKNERLYSTAVHSHGYRFFFFLKLDEMETEKILSGYLRCMALWQEPLDVPTRLFNVPLTLKMIVVDKANNDIANFSETKMIFSCNDKAIGGKIISFESIENRSTNWLCGDSLRILLKLNFTK